MVVGWRGAGRRAEREIEEDNDEEGEEGLEGEVGMTGSFREEAVDGLISWRGEGWRLSEADWRVDVSVAAGSEAIVCLFVRSFEVCGLGTGRKMRVAGGRERGSDGVAVNFTVKYSVLELLDGTIQCQALCW